MAVLKHEDNPVPDPTISRFQRADWSARRVARLVFAVFLFSAIFGLLGKGPLAHTLLQDSHALLRYDRFVRSDCELLIRTQPSSGETLVRVNNYFGPEDQVLLTPAPTRETSTPNARIYAFAAPLHLHPGEPAAIQFRWKPKDAGIHRGEFIIGPSTFDVWTLVYP